VHEPIDFKCLLRVLIEINGNRGGVSYRSYLSAIVFNVLAVVLEYHQFL
jgi:hypothetical protein